MWMPFTSRLFALLTIAVLGGCASGGGTEPDDAEWVSSGTSSPIESKGTAAGGSKGAATAVSKGPATPPPEVKAGNARAFDAAVIAMQDGRYEEAEILLLEITSDQPELAGPWVNLGRVYVARNNIEEARQAFNAALRANPASCEAHNELGILHRHVGDFNTAESHYLACLERLPDYQNAHLNLGILYELYLGRLTDALASYRRYQSIASEPDERVRGWVMDLERRLGV